MTKYRKVTQQVEAWRWLNQKEQGDMPEWLKGILRSKEASMGITGTPAAGRLDIGPLVTMLSARPGDWLLMDDKGVLTACQHHTFETTYEVIPEPPKPEVAEETPPEGGAPAAPGEAAAPAAPPVAEAPTSAAAPAPPAPAGPAPDGSVPG